MVELRNSNLCSDQGEPVQKLVLENALDAVIGMNQSQTILDWNRQAEVMFGWTRSEAIGKKLAEMMVPEHFPTTSDGLVLNQRKEVAGLHKLGHSFPVELTVVPIPANGSFIFYSFARDLTERKKADQERDWLLRASRESEGHFRRLVETAKIIAWEAELATGQFIYVSPQARDILGYPIEDWYTKDFWPCHIHPEDRDFALNYCIENSKTKQDYEFEYRMLTSTGASVWLRDIVSVITRSDGKKILTGYMLDISEQKVAEENLRKSEERLKQVVQSMPVMMNAFDENGIIVAWNEECERVTGFTAQEAIGNPKLLDLLQWKNRGNKGSHSEEEIRCKDGSSKTLSWSDISGLNSISGWASWGIGVDVTQRKKAEEEEKKAKEALEESEAKFKATFHQAAAAMSISTPEGDWIAVNEAYSNMFGYPENELKQLNFKDITHPEDFDDDQKQMERLFSGEITAIIKEKRYFHKDRSVIWGLVHVSLVWDEFSHPKYRVAVVQNITERKRAEEALKEAVKVRDEFLSIASHELKTPLTSLKLQTQLRQRFLEAGNMAAFTSGRLSSMLQIDDRQISRLTRLIDDMLDVSRVNMGKLSMNFETVDLRTVLEEALERFSPQLAEIGCEVVLDPNPSVFVSGDRFRLEQVMINLLTNAQKYGAGKPIRIELMKEDGKARLMVQDRGRGIAKENQERIFSRFERAVSANEISGLGLGLYIVRQILDAHSGRVWVESELKQGAKFFMELPLAGESRIL